MRTGDRGAEGEGRGKKRGMRREGREGGAPT